MVSRILAEGRVGNNFTKNKMQTNFFKIHSKVPLRKHDTHYFPDDVLRENKDLPRFNITIKKNMWHLGDFRGQEREIRKMAYE